MSSFFGARYGSKFILAFRFCNLDANFAKTLKRLRNNVSIAGKSKSMTNTIHQYPTRNKLKKLQTIQNWHSSGHCSQIKILYHINRNSTSLQKYKSILQKQIDTVCLSNPAWCL